MKKVFSIIGGIFFFLLVGICLFFIFRTPIMNLIGKAKDSLGNVVVEYYIMDPDTEEYKKTTEKIRVKEGTTYTFKPDSKKYYDVDTVNSNLTIENVSKDSIITVYYKCQKCTISFNPNGGTISGDSTYIINKGHKFFAPEIVKTGYNISSFNNYKERIYEDTTFTVNWEIAEYMVTLVLPDSCNINDSRFKKLEDSNNYTIVLTYFDDEITLPNVESESYHFRYWKLNNSQITSLKNVSSDLNIVGVFNEKFYTISFVEENGKYYTPIVAKKGDDINPPKIKPEDNIAGYGLVWYLDQNYQNAYSFTRMSSNDITLYGKWEYETGCGFLDYDINKETIDSLSDFVKCIDYVYYNYITSGFSKIITYCSMEEVNAEFQKAADMSEYRSNTPILISTTSRTSIDGEVVTVEIKVDRDTKSYEGTVTAPVNDTTPYNVAGYVEGHNLRSSTYDDFYIEHLTKSYNVKTTNQLLYVVEHGYKPICSSEALTIYNKAKDVLRNIVSDDMTDFEKLERIYQYLTLNIQYDYNALNGDKSWEYYDAYFMEGVFNNKKAVCDGIAKSLVLLCNMEGIPCVEVSGNNHAWCEVKIKNLWYVIDATHGNLGISGTNKSVQDYSEFLISSALKTEKGYPSNEFPSIKCNSTFDYFAYKEFNYDNKTIYLYIESANDLEKVFEYCAYHEEDLTGYSINVELDASLDIAVLIGLAEDRYTLLNHKTFGYSISWSYNKDLSYKVCKLLFN